MANNAREVLSGELLSWPGVTQQPHRFGGIEFQFKGKEIGHMHGDHLVDLLLPKPVRDQVIAAGQASPHHVYPDSGWVSVYLKSDADLDAAIELLRIKYDKLAEKSV
ncbi:luciferase family protein [Paenibacillus caui]|uniref:luciferase domain-containing protein n=1 Tax=Paenibacillus caui TaxID=2873927 RepID=UPI001CA9EE37|nr:luciferase family protein [Paenibacillus caui]